MIAPLPPEKMRHALDSSRIDCKSTDQLTPLKEIIGQDRAIKALEFGLNIQEEGFNIYASGMHGTGRTSAVRKYLAQVAAQKPRGNDWIYVNNFKNPYEPNAIKLPPGTGKTFRDELASFIEEARQLIPKVFESEDYATRRDAAIRNLEQQKGELISRLNAVAQEKSFLIQTSPQGLVIIPTRNGEPIPRKSSRPCPRTCRTITRNEGKNSRLRCATRSASFVNWTRKPRRVLSVSTVMWLSMRSATAWQP